MPDEPEPPLEPAAEPFDPPPAVAARLRVTVRKAPAGRVRLQVRAPRRGKFAVAVRGRVPDADGRLRGTAKLLGSTRKTVRKAGAVTLEVKLAKRYTAVARREKRLDGRATVTFTPDSGAPLTGATSVRFSAPPPPQVNVLVSDMSTSRSKSVNALPRRPHLREAARRPCPGWAGMPGRSGHVSFT